LKDSDTDAAHVEFTDKLVRETKKMSENTYLVSIQKRGILPKVKEREGCNHRNTLKYFEDYNLKRDAEIGQKGRLWMDTI
jgi:hypothetical protein